MMEKCSRYTFKSKKIKSDNHIYVKNNKLLIVVTSVEGSKSGERRK